MSSAHHNFPRARALTHAESAELARAVLDRARQALRAELAGQHRRPVRSGRWRAVAEALSRISQMPGFELLCIGLCLALCTVNVVVQLRP